MYYKLILVFLCYFADTAILFAQYSIPQDGETIPLVRLIVNPDEYHNKIVTIKGYFQYQFENGAVYCSKEYDENGLREYGVWLLSNSDTCKIVLNKVEYNLNS